MKKIIISIILISLLLPVFCLAQEQPAPAEPTQPINVFYARALVKDIQETQKQEQLDGTTQVITQQEVSLLILNTKLADQEFTIINEVTTNPLDIKLTKGDKLIVNIEEYSNNEYRIFITGYYRLNGILLLIGLFLLLLIILGGSQGVKTVISLILSIILIFKILIPQTLNGTDPILIALIISVAIAIITLTFIGGFNKKAFIAILGTLGGLIIAILISFIFAKLTYLNGLSTEEARTLFYKFPNIDPQGVFFAGIIIAALGAVMDVAMSIASSLTEIKQANPNIGFSKLFKSGINVGKDIMGTMSNTLIFAYVGVSLPLLLLYTEFGDSYINFINLDFITDEIVRSIGGSIGLITVIPITSLLAAFLYSKKK
jgi:uncharacterized membrane protein